MSSWRSSDLTSRRPQPPVPGAANYRGLAPVRLDGGSARRIGYGPGRDFGRGPEGRLSRLLRRIFGPGSPLRHLDWILLTAVLALSLVGTLMVWSATDTNGLNSSDPFLTKQLLNLAIGLALMAGVSMLDYRQLRLYSPIVLGLSCLGLLAVLTPLGSVVNGAKSWISLPGGFQIEPSEYAKLSIILVGAMILSEIRPAETRPRPRALGLTVALSAVPLVLVVAEPDLGVTMLMLALLVGIIALSGVRLRWLAGLLALSALAITGVVKLHLLKAYQVSRLTSFINPSADPRGTGYSAYQSKIAIGSGGLTGQGLFHGHLVAGGFGHDQIPYSGRAFGLYLRGGRRRGRLCRLHGDHRPARHRAAARDQDRGARRRSVRHARGIRGGDLVRGPVVHQHRHDDRHHARHRTAAPIRLLRRISDVR